MIRSRRGRDNRDRWDGQLARIGRGRTALTPARQKAEHESGEDYQSDNGANEASAFGWRLGGWFIVRLCRRPGWSRGLGRVRQETVCLRTCSRFGSNGVLPVLRGFGNFVVL